MMSTILIYLNNQFQFDESLVGRISRKLKIRIKSLENLQKLNNNNDNKDLNVLSSKMTGARKLPNLNHLKVRFTVIRNALNNVALAL